MQLDLTPLRTPVTREDVREFRQANRGSDRFASVARVLLLVVVAAVFLGAIGSFLATWITAGGDGFGIVLALAVMGIGVIGLAGIVSFGAARRELILTRFADANGLVYAKGGSASHEGLIFGLGHSRRVVERFLRPDRSLELANYSYTTGSGKNRTVHRWTYLALRLPRRVPHMLLDAKRNNFLGSNLPVAFRRDQVLSLEGDFDRYFTLYCPREYETDALYVFTPDLMALLIDEADDVDIEIVDNTMLVYRRGHADFTDPGVHSRFFHLAQTVGETTRRRTSRYADDRAAPADLGPFPGSETGAPHTNALSARLAHDSIAPAGRRLRRGFPGVALAVAVAAVMVWMLFRFVA